MDYKITPLKIGVAVVGVSAALVVVATSAKLLPRIVPEDNNKVAVESVGKLSGTVRKTSGDCMPQIIDRPDGTNHSTCQTVSVPAVVQVRSAMKDFDGEYEVITTVNTDENGKFEVELPAGDYSIFVGEEGATCAGVDCGEYQINFTCRHNDKYWCSVEIKAGETTIYDPKINVAVY